MSNIDLLEAVQPSDGWFAIVGIKGKLPSTTSNSGTFILGSLNIYQERIGLRRT
mgnify:CR=1 FL=1